MSVKDWERAWTFDEIVENASNWSLAGDAGLLKNLEAFADNLFEKTNKTNDNLNKLLANLDSASIRLDLIKNEFLSLQNTQFVESRVYEDDETFQPPIPVKEEKAKPNNEEKLKNLRNAVLEGIEILDKYYEKVPVDASDTEDEVDFVSYVLRPKDPYLDRPLPYVIGSEEWHKKWHVGLQDSSSESEHEEETDKFSDTDSEDNLPVPDRRRDLVSTSDDSDLSKPVASSTFNDTDSEDNSIPAKDLLPKESFAEQLAARLGNVVVESAKEEPEQINNRPIKPAVPKTNQRLFGDLFSNEPPPLVESEDEHAAQGMFSGGQGLFDESDDENESFWGQKIPPKNQTQPSGHKNGPSSSTSSTLLKQESKVSSGLFDDSDEDGIFGEVKTEKSPYLKPFNSGPVFIDDEPPELIIKPKPDNNKNLIDEIKKKVVKGNVAEEVERITEVEVKKPAENESKKKIAGGLFDEPVDLFQDELFGDVSTSDLFSEDTFNKKKKFVGLFDEEDDRETPPPLVNQEQEKLDTSTSRNLFEDDNDDDDDFLFAEKKPQESKIPSLFDDQPPPDPDWDTSSQKNLFDDEDDDNDFLQTPAAPVNPSQRFSLFDDEPPDLDFHKGKTTNLFDEEDPEEHAVAPKDVNVQTIQDDLNVLDKSDINIRDKLMNAAKDKEDLYKKTVNINSQTAPVKNDASGKNGLLKTVNMFDEEEEEEDAWVDEVEHDIYNNSNQKRNDLGSEVKIDVENSDKDKDKDDVVTSVSNNVNVDENIPVDSKVENNDSCVGVVKSNKKNDVDDEFKEVEVAARKKISLFEDPDVSEDELFSDKNLLVSHKPATDLFSTERKEIKKITKQSKLFEDYEEDLEKTPENLKSPPPGKLKSNLNINVAALMPGAVLPKRRETEVDDVVVCQEKDKEKPFESSYKSEDGVFNEDDPPVETLYSVTKTRARIPIKRKPSSRKARQESMKKSASQDDDKNNNIENDDVVNENVEVVKKSEILEQISKTSKNLFDDDDDDDSDIFNTVSSKPKVSKSLFDEEDYDDDEDDLFKPTKKEKNKKTETISQTKQGSLFDDLSDDDGDIFNSKSKPLFNKSVTKQTIKVSKAKNSLRKSEECELLEDPLDALNK